MIKKNYISILTFLGLFIVGFIYLNKFFITPHIFINSANDFKKLTKKTNIDVIFYGSSHSYMDFNPLIINNTCKTISYNLGSDAQRLVTTNFVIEESLKYTKPKLIVVEIYPASIKFPKTEKSKGIQLRALDFISPLSKTKIDAIKSIYNKNEYLGIYSPLIRNHKKWNKIDLGLSKRLSINSDEYFFYDGYLGGYQKVSKKERDKYPDFKNVIPKRVSKKQIISSQEKNELIKLVNNAKEKNIEVLIISSPDFRVRFNNYNFYDELNEVCKSLSVPYLNLNDFYDEIGIIYDDFLDVYHLNIKGGIKTTQFLGEYINQNFIIPNRSGDNLWKEKNVGLKDFINQKSVIKTFEKTTSLKLTENIIIKKINITKTRNQYSSKLTIDNLNLSKNELKNNKLAIHVHPIKTELSLLNNFSKSENRKFDLFDIYINEHYKDSVISFNFKTKIKHFNVKLYIYKKGGSVVGKTINIKDIDFK